MAESPAIPTDEILWCSTGSNVASTTGTHQADGWAAGEIPPSDEENYWRRAIVRHLQWLRSIAIRRFDTVREGVAEAIEESQLDGYRFETPGTNRTNGWGQEVITKSAAAYTGNLSRVATDGVNVYVVQNGNTLRAFQCAPGAGAVAQEWSATGWSGTPLRVECDGDMVILTTSTTIYAYAASNGALIDSLSRTNYSCGAVPISHDGERFVYLLRVAGGGAPSFEVWDATNQTETEVVSEIAWGAGTPQIVAGCHASDVVFLLGRGVNAADEWKIRRLDISGASGSWLIETGFDETDTQWGGICTDGTRLYLALENVGLWALPLSRATTSSSASGFGSAIWTADAEPDGATAPTNGEDGSLGTMGRIQMAVDERYLYVLWPSDSRVYVYDKTTGALIAQATSGAGVDFAMDGSYIWRVDGSSQNLVNQGTIRGQTSWVTVNPASDRSQQRRYTNLIAQPLASAR